MSKRSEKKPGADIAEDRRLKRDQRIFRWYRRGYAKSEIAEMMGLSHMTVSIAVSKFEGSQKPMNLRLGEDYIALRLKT